LWNINHKSYNIIQMENQHFAVITADLFGSTLMDAEEKINIQKVLYSVFSNYEHCSPYSKAERNYFTYRGDSYQLILTAVDRAIEAALLMKAAVKCIDAKFDVRLAIGLGSVEQMTSRINDSDGEAFRSSGQLLESMKDEGIRIKVPNQSFADGLNASLILLDHIIDSWSREMAEAVYYSLLGMTQSEIAKKIGVSQPAINNRLKNAHLSGIKAIMNYYTSYAKKYYT